MTITEFPPAWLPLVDSVVKATIVLGIAGVVTATLRRASAALRHLIWTVALVSALLMPVLSLALPRWSMPIITVASRDLGTVTIGNESQVPAPPLKSVRSERSTATAHEPPQAGAPAVTPPSSTFAGSWTNVSWPLVLLGLWTAGLLLIVGRVVAGAIAVTLMVRRGQRVLDAPWMKMAVELASEVGVSSNITFLRSGRASMPMACGILRPAVMMPAEADEWPAERLRIVLLHELAHVKRRDCLTHVVAQLACALHWFNPLAWVAARNLRTERERACDDLVLASGTRGPDYADQLLEIARVMRSGRFPAVLAGASLAMAHRSQLEGRLMAILDPRVPHSGLTRLRAAAATTICCAAVIPLAAVQPWEQKKAGTPDTTISAAPPTGAPPPAASVVIPTPAPQPVPTPAVETPPARNAMAPTADAIAEGTHNGATEATFERAETSTVESTVSGVLGAVFGPAADTQESDEHQTAKEDPQEKKPVTGKGDPRMVAALTAALKDTDKEVRETAMHALVQMRHPAIFEPLTQALKDASPDVREQAAFGLGQLRDRRAVEPLSGALKDTHANVREQAAFALGQLRDRGAIPALSAAVKDSDPDVREQVIFALGQLRDPATIDGLSQALHDTNADVREQAAFALGQIRDRRAVEPLISALKDTDADVREQAAFALGQIRDRGAVEALVIALKDSSASVREQAAFALGQIRDPRAIDGLTTALKDPQASVRQQAAFALGQLAR